MTTLPGKIVAIHSALASGEIAHAFGGALALAWCTQRARGTIDIDVNLFVDSANAPEVLPSLPGEVVWTADDVEMIERDGHVRLWWDSTPVDVFFDTTDFHRQAATRVRWEDFGGTLLPFLSCADLAVFKAFFNRTRDWADLEEMHAAGTLDHDRVIGVLVRYLGRDDERIDHLLEVTAT